MEAVLALFHVIFALFLIVIILIQDPKGGSTGMFSGGAAGSNSLFGTTGAPTFLSKLTRYLGILFAFTCIALVISSKPDTSSTIDRVEIPQTNQQAPAANPENSDAPQDNGKETK